MNQIERVARALCVAENVDPDAHGYAITEETKVRLGAQYPLWRYRVSAAQAAISAFEPIAGSSNGRTADFESVNLGSSPSPATR